MKVFEPKTCREKPEPLTAVCRNWGGRSLQDSFVVDLSFWFRRKISGKSPRCAKPQNNITNKMNLKPIALQEDKSNETYASADCQQLLSMYDDFYPKICFNIPWVGYFVVSHTGFTRGINNLTINFVVKTIEQRVKR